MIDDSEVKIEIVSGNKVVISHGWSEMGQDTYCRHPDTASGNRNRSLVN